jgi:ribosomal protein S18 acetylase RimI-like enzyme
MKKLDLIFKKATTEDLADIIEINNSYLKYSDDQGFLITKYEINQLKNHILSNPDSISIAITGDNIIVGFIQISFLLDVNVINELEWYGENLRSTFEKGKKLYIEKVAVKREYRGEDLGMFMYESIFAKYPDYIFYSFVVKKPSTNIVSLKFHKKMGFIEAAEFKANKFLDIENYESVMLMKFDYEI